MGLTTIERFTAMAIETLRRNILLALEDFGVELVNMTRDRLPEESWNDITGNLRSSVGSAVYEDGKKLVASAFEQIAEGSVGSGKGKAYVDELAMKFAECYGLAVVAGMDYASHVEAMEDKDVLASAENYARARIKEKIEHAVELAAKAIARTKIK